MRFAAVHKVSSYLMVAAAFTALALSGELSPAVLAFTALGIVTSFFAEPERLPLMRGRAWQTGWNVAMVVAAAWAVLRVVSGDGLPIVGATFLCFLCVTKLWNRRASRDWLQLYAISFLMLVVGTVLNAELVYAVCFVFYVVFATWTLTLFHLRREMEDNYLVKHSDGGASQRVAVERILNSRRVIGGSFLASTSLLSLSIFLGSAVFFFLFPRIGFNLFGRNLRQGLSVGFNDSGVSLGQNGLIKDNDAVVMRVEFPDGRPPTPLYFRGISFDHYQSGRWTPSETGEKPALPSRGNVSYLAPLPHPDPTGALAREVLDGALRLEVYLEPMESSVLFAAERPVAVEAAPPRFGLPPTLRGSWVDGPTGIPTGDVYLEGRQRGIHYTAWSRPDPPLRDRLDAAPDLPAKDRERFAPYLDTSSVPPRVLELARKLTHGLTGPDRKAKALMAYLANGFTYTLDLKHDPRRDPIEEFLFYRRAGHCEYFASALALMLRAVGVPARHVAGFYGGEWNDMGHYLEIRQHDAHAWVEAWMGRDVGWVPLDATPSSQLSGERSLGTGLRELLDVVELAWFKYVIEYDLATQLELVVKLRDSLGKTVLAQSGPGGGGKAWLARHRRVLGLGFGTLAAVVVLLLALRRPRGEAGSQARRHHATRALDRAVAALARRGVQRRTGDTPAELARRAKERGDPGARAFDELVGLYYAARFGHRPFDAVRIERLADEVARPPGNDGQRRAAA